MSENKSPMLSPTPFREIGKQAAMSARDSLLRVFESQGISEEVVATVANDLLYATKVKVQWDKASGTFKYSKDLWDNPTRLKALELIMHFFDVMPSKRIDINDTRQTKELANLLLGKMEEAGLLGHDDVTLPPGAETGEGELMMEMVEKKRGSFVPRDEEEETDE